MVRSCVDKALGDTLSPANLPKDLGILRKQ